ncbi:1538_t:CDS:1, partial [Funneliformis geosporum]
INKAKQSKLQQVVQPSLITIILWETGIFPLDIEKRKQVPDNRYKAPTDIDHNDIDYDDYEIDESLDPINKTEPDQVSNCAKMS